MATELSALTYRALQAKAKSLGIKASGSKEALAEAISAASAPSSPAPKAKASGGVRSIAFDEVQTHATAADCWCVIGKGVYDLSEFAPEHPGGAGVVTELAGKVATEAFLHAHPEDIMTMTMGKKGLAKARMGDTDLSTLPAPAAKKKGKTVAKKADDVDDDVLDMSKPPPLMACLNLHDFEAIAQRVMVATGRKQAWDYYSSGACDEVTYSENVRAYQRIFLKPRILVDVHDVDVSTNILGTASTLPVYLSAVAMCGMGHPEGECSWTGAAGNFGNIFMVPNLSSKPFSEIVGARTKPSQPLWFQIYVNPDRDIVLDKLKECEAAGVEALCITVDSAVAGKRERDLRNKLALQMKQIAAAKAAAKGTKSRKAGQYANRDPALNWSDVAWFKKKTSMKIVIKGVQTGLDAVLAAKAGVDAIILSNHGGRNLDSARSGIEVLPEVMRDLRDAGLEGDIEVFVDGGIRRGTDVLKALALGATAVGVGKPAVYSMSAYGQEGIEKMLQILKDELVMAMRLCGATKISDLTPALVNTVDLDRHTGGFAIPRSPFAPPRFPPPPAAAVADKAGAGEVTITCPPWASTLVELVVVMLRKIVKTTFAASSGEMLMRSAIFMLSFLVVHMLGNLTVFFGAETFNTYGHKMTHSLGIKLVEAYLLVVGVVHALAATALTWPKRKYIAKKPMERGKLAASGTVLLVFLVLHLWHFRFGKGEEEGYTEEYNGVQMRDLYRLDVELFSGSQGTYQLGFYLLALLSVALHLFSGWHKAVKKMDATKEQEPAFTKLGHALIWPLVAGFAIGPIYVWAAQRPELGVIPESWLIKPEL